MNFDFEVSRVPCIILILTILHSEWPKLNGVLAILSAVGFMETIQFYISFKGL